MKNMCMKKVGGLNQCEEYNLIYEEVFWAKKCEEWCRKHKSCSLEITEHTVRKTGLSLS
jgi:hypothetical protein